MIFVWIPLSIVCLGIVAAFLQRRYIRKNGISAEEQNRAEEPDAETCCGLHAVCEKESLLAAAGQEIVYYDDEELDVFQGRPSDSYTSGETALFADVLYTLRSSEVAGWVRSLQLRGVSLPDALKDEVVLIVGERRR
ncbi:MAG: phospholipase [Coprobacter sp.]|nr:phospholipase [Coprobacter sp.]